ncbi:MAG: hypothetical protein C0462_06320 [Alcanivorax sp.]|nr:hypothetical protein [Alcanivorax sp.]
MRVYPFSGLMMCAAFLVGCAGKPPFLLTGEEGWDAESGFAVGEIRVNLVDPDENSVFPDAEGLAAIYRQAMSESFAEKKMLSSSEGVNELNCDINYQRFYMFGRSTGSLSHQEVSHICRITRGGKVIAVSERGPYRPQRGGVYAEAARSLRGIVVKTSPDSEKKDVEMMADLIVLDVEQSRP